MRTYISSSPKLIFIFFAACSLGLCFRFIYIDFRIALQLYYPVIHYSPFQGGGLVVGLCSLLLTSEFR